MFLLKKLFQLRNETNPEEEKPFLEHLEDLRSTVGRLILVILAGFIACIFFRNDLMSLMRQPIDNVWKLQLVSALHGLPMEVDPVTWEKAAKASREGAALDEEQRLAFFEAIAAGDPGFAFHAAAVTYYRSALAIEDPEARQNYLNTLPGISPEMRTQLSALVSAYDQSGGLGPDPDADSRQRTVFMQSLHPTEGFMLSFKLALYAGIAITFPLLLYFILQFILPGLHKNEKKAVFPAIAIGFGLFLTGVCFAYAAVLPRVLEFFTSYDSGLGITNEWRIGEYISFATQFVLIFGLAFELPVVVMTLVMIGILNYSAMVKTRSYAIVAIVVIAAVITPTPDAMTLLLLAGPMYFLYELCIWLAWFVERKQRKKQQAEEQAEEARLAKYVKTLEAHDSETLQEMTVSPPAHLVEYDPEQGGSASLEGSGEALDPAAEASEAGETQDEEEEEDRPPR